jgi:hypothetical protein
MNYGLHLASALILTFAAAAPARAQLLEGGGRSIALGRAGVALDDDAWAEANPAVWATVDRLRFDVFASQAFGLADLRTVALALALPMRLGTAAMTGRTYGSVDYRETRASVGLARALPLGPARRVAAGLRADYHSVVIGDGFGAFGAFDLSAGVQADLAPALRAGLSARNLVAISRSDSTDLRTPLSTSPALAAGLAYRPSEWTLMLVDVVKDLDFAPLVHAGVEIRPVDALTLRVGTYAGAGGAPARLTFGAGFHAGSLSADAAVEWHGTLGPSPAFGLGVRL